MYMSENELLIIFNEMLDECHEPFKIGYLEYEASRTLKEIDPIAYEEEFRNFVDSYFDGEYQEYKYGYRTMPSDEELEQERQEEIDENLIDEALEERAGI